MIFGGSESFYQITLLDCYSVLQYYINVDDAGSTDDLYNQLMDSCIPSQIECNSFISQFGNSNYDPLSLYCNRAANNIDGLIIYNNNKESLNLLIYFSDSFL